MWRNWNKAAANLILIGAGSAVLLLFVWGIVGLVQLGPRSAIDHLTLPHKIGITFFALALSLWLLNLAVEAIGRRAFPHMYTEPPLEDIICEPISAGGEPQLKIEDVMVLLESHKETQTLPSYDGIRNLLKSGNRAQKEHADMMLQNLAKPPKYGAKFPCATQQKLKTQLQTVAPAPFGASHA